MKETPELRIPMRSPFPATFSLYLIALLALAVDGRSEIKVSSDFEGASVEVLELDSEKQFLKVMPADHPGKGWRCWWFFRVDGLKPNSTLTLEVGDAPWATPDQAHFSIDKGKTWQHTALGKRTEKQIRYEIPIANSDSILLAWGPPFTPADAQALVEEIATRSETASAFNLATTRENRPTPALKITAPGNSDDRSVIWFQARQHAWESGSSWVAKGLAEFLASEKPSAQKLRAENVIYLVPIMDIDNTARGAGGKNQKPQDHNRDWSKNPHWNAVAAAQKLIREANDTGKFKLFIDLHNPGAQNRFPYFYIPPRGHLSKLGNENLDRFLNTAKAEITGPLRFMGTALESGPKYDRMNWTKISKNWVSENTADGVVAVTLETAWNTPSSTTQHYQTIGAELGRTISKLDLTAPIPDSESVHKICNTVVREYADWAHQSYQAAHAGTLDLKNAITDFVSDPSAEKFQIAKLKWIEARQPYLQTEVFRYSGGPIDNEDGPEPMINGWPMDEAYVDYVEGSDGTGIIGNVKDFPEITTEVLVATNGKGGETLISCGFHAIEFLLWGQDFNDDGPGERPFTDYTTRANADRRATYLKLCAELLETHLKELVAEWAPGDSKNFRAQFLADDPKKSVRDVITGIKTFSGLELSGERLLVPWDTQLQEDEHSCFSDTTHQDVFYDAKGIQNVFENTRLKELAAHFGKREALERKIAEMMTAAETIPRPFDQVIMGERDSEERRKILKLVEILEDQSALWGELEQEVLKQ